MKTLLASLTLVLAIGLVGAGCRSITGQSFGQEVNDTQITAAVKAKLVADRAKNLTAVDVDTINGTVYLKGFVNTAQQKEDAALLTKTVGGVKQVVNNLQVQPVTAAPAGTATTQQPSPAASPATGTFIGRHTMTGEVKDLDRDRGRIELKTAEGDIHLHFPPSALRNVQKGDRITVELALSPAP